MSEHALFVCTTCSSTWKDGKIIGTSGGEKLLEVLNKNHQNWEFKARFPIHPVACMSACDRSCAISFAAPGKYTYLFGDLPANEETLETVSEAILQCASQYYTKADGMLPWSERPEQLKKGIVARIPPLTG